MKILNTACDPDNFFYNLSRAKNRMLFMDYDGTLAPFQIERDKAFPYPGVRELLESIMRTACSKLIIVSGRTINDLAKVIGVEPLPELWGSHGWERMLIDGRYIVPELDINAVAGLEEAFRLAQDEGLGPMCETKTGCLALHLRGRAPQTIEKVLTSIEKRWNAIAINAGLVMREFNGGLELKIQGRDKGFAVNTVIEESDGDVLAAYCGDDMTDEDAFEVLESRGLSVLVNTAFHDTAADIWIEPPDELLLFLRRWIKVCGGGTWQSS